jgi:hypothetical protein
MLHFSKANRDDMALRYGRSVLLSEGKAFYAVDFVREGCSGYDLSTGEMVTVPMESLSSEFPRLGYLDQQGGEGIYACRLPIRYYKQGLTSRNCRLQGIGLGIEDLATARSLSASFQRMIENKYEPLSQVLNRPQGGALSKYFYKFRESLMYRGRFVGSFSTDGNMIFDSQYQYLTDEWEEIST